MKPSRFNITIPMENKGDYLIYNTFSKNYAVVDNDAKSVIEKLGRKIELNEDEKYIVNQLKEADIVVDDEVDEDLELEYHFQKNKFDTSVLSVNILTTYGCNLNCVYCFQDGVKASVLIDMEMCNKVAAWLCERMEKVRPEILRVVFYGGEPLLNIKAIKFLSQLLFLAASQRNITVESSIITNGVLLNEELIDELIPWGLKSIRVTLDGDKSAHNSKRYFKDGRGTFDLILKNLEKIKGRVPIYLNGNFDDSTRDKFPALLDTLVDRGFKGYIGGITFKTILKNIESAIVGNNNCSDVCTFSDMSNVGDMLFLIRETEKRGFKSGMGVALGPCEVSKECSYTIDPEGKIYKCGGFVGRKEFVIGDLSKQGFNYKLAQFMTTDTWRGDCKGCSYMPLCGGGCRAAAYVKHGNFQKVACDSLYFEDVSQELMKEAA
ncbi:MAG: radical SAM protein [Nitrospinae bacterium]|nr:radical SAM protein [Nitrospinota bacterium]